MIEKDREEGKEYFPEFPEENQKAGHFSVEEKEIQDNLAEFCSDIASVPFEIWHILNKDIEPLTEVEKKAIGKPVARIIVKYNLQDYAKDEIYLAFILSGIMFKRINQVKKSKNVNNNNREKGNRENNVNKKDNSEA